MSPKNENLTFSFFLFLFFNFFYLSNFPFGGTSGTRKHPGQTGVIKTGQAR